MGFDVVSHFSFLCHFTNQDKEKTELNKNYLLKLSKNKKIIALPEEVEQKSAWEWCGIFI